jgi:signal transduction histidine kinase
MSTNTWSLLLVEPDLDDAELARRILTQELDGCQVCIATDAVGYATHFADGEFSAVISELDLGWGSGTEVLTSFAQRKPDTRLILFARKLPSDIQRLSNEIGLAGYAEKSGAGFLRLPHLVKAALDDERSNDGGEIFWTLAMEELEAPALTALRDGRILEANRLAARVFGYRNRDDLLGLKLAVLFDSSSRSSSEEDEFLGQLRTLGSEDVKRLEMVAVPARDPLGVGRRRLVGWPIPNSPRVAFVYHALAHVDTEIAAAREEHKHQAYTELLHAVSHDLQEPLQLILRHAKVLRDAYGKKLDDNGARFVDNLLSNSGRMQSMLDDLLEFSRIGRMETAVSEVDLNAVVGEIVDLYQPRLAEIGGQVQCKELPKVVADRGQMIRLFQNLIGNAIKFHGANPLVVLIEARRKEGYSELIVEDNGIGIDAAESDAIFGMFRRLHTQDEYPGNGIGLATCRRIVRLHGGEIWARPSESRNRGMVVHFTLPCTLYSFDANIEESRITN